LGGRADEDIIAARAPRTTADLIGKSVIAKVVLPASNPKHDLTVGDHANGQAGQWFGQRETVIGCRGIERILSERVGALRRRTSTEDVFTRGGREFSRTLRADKAVRNRNVERLKIVVSRRKILHAPRRNTHRHKRNPSDRVSHESPFFG